MVLEVFVLVYLRPSISSSSFYLVYGGIYHIIYRMSLRSSVIIIIIIIIIYGGAN